MRRQYCSGNIAPLCVHADLIMLISMPSTVYFEQKEKRQSFVVPRNMNLNIVFKESSL
jgi:hypothetical protein